MKALKCLILDDEPLGREIIEEYVKNTPFLECAASFGKPLEALQFLQNNKVDILLSDIEMPQLNGLQLINSLEEKPLVILITAYRDYAIDGFNSGVIDYLVKPVGYDRFLKAVNRAQEQLQLKQANQEEAATDKIFIKSEGKLFKLMLEDIIFAEAQGDYLKIVTKTGDYTTLATLKSMDEILCPPKFFRIQRSFIINLSEVQAIVGNVVELTGGHSASVAVNKKEELLTLLGAK